MLPISERGVELALLAFLTLAQVIGYLVRRNEARKTQPPAELKSAESNGYDKRLRDAEQGLKGVTGDVGYLKERIEALHHKASNEGDRAQKFIDKAEQRFVLTKVCDERHRQD